MQVPITGLERWAIKAWFRAIDDIEIQTPYHDSFLPGLKKKIHQLLQAPTSHKKPNRSSYSVETLIKYTRNPVRIPRATIKSLKNRIHSECTMAHTQRRSKKTIRNSPVNHLSPPLQNHDNISPPHTTSYPHASATFTLAAETHLESEATYSYLPHRR